MNYQTIVQKLQLNKNFRQEHQGTVRTKLLAAGRGILEGRRPLQPMETDEEATGPLSTDLFSINQCLHLASTVLLLGSTPQHLGETLHYVKEMFKDHDAATVVTSAVLYDLIVRLEK